VLGISVRAGSSGQEQTDPCKERKKN